MRGFAALAVANGLGQAIGFVVLAVVARRIGPANLGAYTFAQTFALYFTLPMVMGIAVLGIRDIARAPERTREVAGELLGLQVGLALLCLAVMAVASLWLAPSANIRTLVLIVGVGWLCRAFDLEAILQARQTLGALAIMILLGQVVYGALTPLLVTGGFDGARTYTWLNQLGFAVTSFGATAVVWWRFGAPKLRVDPRPLARRYARGLPLGLPLLIGNVYMSAGAIMIGYLKPARDVGLWGAGSKVPLSAFIFVTLWTQAFYPHAAVLAHRDPDRIRRQVARLSSMFVVIALPLAIGSSVLAGDLMVAVFGSAYAGAGGCFALLMWWIAVNMISINFSDVLFAAGYERAVAVAIAIGATVSIGLGLLLIPPFGATGAAGALLTASVVILGLQVHGFRSALGLAPAEWPRMARGLAAALVMAGVVALLPDSLSVWLRVTAGAGTFLVAAIMLGAITRAELVALARRRPELAEPTR